MVGVCDYYGEFTVYVLSHIALQVTSDVYVILQLDSKSAIDIARSRENTMI